jgi:hypothetical protein
MTPPRRRPLRPDVEELGSTPADRPDVRTDEPPSLVETGTAAEPGEPGGLGAVVRRHAVADARLRVAGRFEDPGAALAYLGQVADAGRSRQAAGGEPAVARDDGTWWVSGDLPLRQARELVELCGGRPLVRDGSRWLTDRGWGEPPRPTTPGAVPVADPEPVAAVDLVRAAGLTRLPTGREQQVAVLVPAGRAVQLLHRALDLGLATTVRAVAVEPLFGTADGTGAADPGASGDGVGARGTLVEVRLRVRDQGPDPHLPTALLAALDRDPNLLACRAVDDRLLVQHGRRSPLADRQLSGLVDEPTWVLADPPHGCWRLTPLGEATDASSLVRLADSVSLVPGDPTWPDDGTGEPLRPEPMSVVPAATPEAAVDALLLTDEDLRYLPALLEGHPIAELAELVVGRDRHLLIAAGGVLERIPIGEYLYAVGPGPVYLPHGWRTRPRLPGTAWRELLDVGAQVALVLLAERSLAFDLSGRRPVWELWAGDLPPLTVELPPGARSVLQEIDAAQVPAQPPARARPERAPARATGLRGMIERLQAVRPTRRPRSWQEEATEAELQGDLFRAADLFDRHGQPRRAAHLFERAAREGSVPSKPRSR